MKKTMATPQPPQALPRRRSLVRPHARLGISVYPDGGGAFTIFRETSIKGPVSERPAVLIARFHLRLTRPGRSIRHRFFQRICIITTPTFVWLPGYRTKLWAFDAFSGDYAGFYEWDGADRADSYARRLLPILRALSNRGSASCEVRPGERLEHYLAARSSDPASAAGHDGGIRMGRRARRRTVAL